MTTNQLDPSIDDADRMALIETLGSLPEHGLRALERSFVSHHRDAGAAKAMADKALDRAITHMALVQMEMVRRGIVIPGKGYVQPDGSVGPVSPR